MNKAKIRGHPNFLILIGREPGRRLQTAETCTITDCACVLADASNETPQCLADKHTYEDLESWLERCNEDTVENREVVQLWLRDCTTQRDDVMVKTESPYCNENRVPVAPRTGLRLALKEACDQKMVIELHSPSKKLGTHTACKPSLSVHQQNCKHCSILHVNKHVIV